MRWKRLIIGILIQLAVLALGLWEVERHLIPILHARTGASAVLRALLAGVLVSVIGWSLLRILEDRHPRTAQRGQSVFWSAGALFGTAFGLVYEAVKGRVLVSVLFAALFLICLVGVISACSTSIRLPRRKAPVKPGALHLSAAPDGDGLRLQYHGALRKKDGRRDARLEQVSGEALVPPDFFWERDADRAAKAIRRLLPSIALQLEASECSVLDPTGTETELRSFLPYRFLRAGSEPPAGLSEEAVLMHTECFTEGVSCKCRYSVGTSAGARFLHLHTENPSGDTFYRLPRAFFFRDAEQTVQSELLDWARCADARLFAAIRDGREHTVRFSDDFSERISALGYAQPEALSRADYTPLQVVPFPHIPLLLERPFMITKPEESAMHANEYRFGLAKGRVYLHSVGDQQDAWGDWDTQDRYFMLAGDFFHAPEAHIRQYLIELALGSERALFSALDSARQLPTVRFSQAFSEILAQFRALEPFPYKQLGRAQETCGIP